MTVKLLALYRKPQDVDAFLAHYNDVHMPLIAKVPGLQKAVVNRVDKTLMGDNPYFLIAELHFADQAAFDAGMASPENRAAGKDLMSFARDLVTLIAVGEQSA
ncbi:EthD family reductase [Caulobacter soli]|uniref:EthD family reductase n=1 Tax=Caulobacter soli TaxID=2708539 RepID=UPI0013ECFE96|nr:EthD family reductase [Caulobacter soli]